MNKRTKVILSIIGISAIIIPAVLLKVLNFSSKELPTGSSEGRSVNTGAVQEAVKKNKNVSQMVSPTPKPATSSALPATSSASPVSGAEPSE